MKNTNNHPEMYDPLRAGDMNLVKNIAWLWKTRRRYTLEETIEECILGAIAGATFAALIIF